MKTPIALVLALIFAAALPLGAAAQYSATAQPPLAGDVVVGVLPPVAGGFDWTHGTGTTVDVGQTFTAPAGVAMQAVTVRVAVEDGVAGRSVELQVLELGADGDPAGGTPLAATAAPLPLALAPGVTLYLTLRLPAALSLAAGSRYAFRLHFEGGGGVNLARAVLLQGGDAYAGGTAFEEEGGFVRALPGDLLFLVHGAAGGCVDDDLTLCLRDDRFRLQAAFSTDGVLYRGAGAEPMTADTGWFWFFNADNVELVSKILDGCAVNGHYWVFTAGLTDVEVYLRVTDTASEPPAVRDYHNPRLRDFPPILDAAAYATCP